MKPYVTLTFAQSLDGNIATHTGASRYISEEGSLALSQTLRRDHDAILVGIGTVIADDPLLTCRIKEEANPIRIIADSHLAISPQSAIVASANRVPTIVCYNARSGQIPKSKRDTLISNGVELLAVPPGSGGLDMAAMMELLGDKSIRTLMVEGGSGIITSCIRQNIWNSMIVITTAKIIGRGIPPIGDLHIRHIQDIVEPTIEDIEILGSEVVWKLSNPALLTPSPLKKSITTRALFFTGVRKVALRPHTIKASSGRQTLVSSLLMAISPGTERQLYQGNISPRPANPAIDCTDGTFAYPFMYGYINVVEHEGARYFGFLPHAEDHFVDLSSLIPIEISPTQALFIPHMETALSFVHDSDARMGDRVLITGAGVVGTLTARLLSSMGIEVVVVDSNPLKKKWFSNNFFDPASPQVGTNYDIVIEVSGSEQALQYCMERVVFEGTITVGSWYGERPLALNLGADFHTRRLCLKSSQVSHIDAARGRGWSKERRMKQVLQLLTRIQVEDLLTHSFPFSGSPQAYALLASNHLYGLIALVPGQ